MYDDHYGLSGRPFQLTPDPRFWFDTATHKKAMAYLGYGLSQGEGFIVITGDPGTGKTTLVGHLMATIDRERLNVIKIVTTQIEAEDLLHMVAAGLGIDSTGMIKSQLLAQIERGLHGMARTGKRTLLIVDEAQALPIASLEELRMLSNFQAGGYPLLQIFLLGQPEFRQRLQDPRLEQLRQRVIAMHHLAPMGAEELESYIIHRLSVVGWRGRPRFTNNALAAIHRWSGGVPRRVNQLAGRVLLYGAIEQIDSFNGEDLELVIADLDSDTPMPTAGRTPLSAASSLPRSTPLPMGAPTPPPVELKSVPPQPAPAPIAEAPAPALAPAVEAPAEPAAAAPQEEPALASRLAQLESRLVEQDEALRRVLTLLVDWVEGDGRKPDMAQLRGTAA